MLVIYTLALKASCLPGLPIVWGLSGLGRKKESGAMQEDDTESRQLWHRRQVSLCEAESRSHELPLFLLVSLFRMRPTAQPMSINKQPMTICPSWLQLSKQRNIARSWIRASPPPWPRWSLGSTQVPRKRVSWSLDKNPQRHFSSSPRPQLEDGVSQTFVRLSGRRRSRRRKAFLSAQGTQMRSSLSVVWFFKKKITLVV